MDKVSGDEGGEDEDAEAEAGKKRKASSPPVYVVEPPDRLSHRGPRYPKLKNLHPEARRRKKYVSDEDEE